MTAPTPPLDLSEVLGEAWCVTLTRRAPDDALRVMGVSAPVPMPDGLDRLDARLDDPDGAAGGVLLLGRPLGDGWTFVLELEGTTGWVGTDPDVLGTLSTGGLACTVTEDPNGLSAVLGEGGGVTSGLDLITGRLWGSPGDGPAAGLATLGIDPHDVGAQEAPEALLIGTVGQAVALVAEAMTGVRLDADVLDGPWTGGVAVGTAGSAAHS